MPQRSVSCLALLALTLVLAPVVMTAMAVDADAAPPARQLAASVAASGDHFVEAVRDEDTGEEIVHVLLRGGAGSLDEEQVLLRSPAPGDGLRYSVSMDGDVVVVGDPVTGLVRVFGLSRATRRWHEEEPLLPPGDASPADRDAFGARVLVRGDVIYTSSPDDGRVLAWRRTRPGWASGVPAPAGFPAAPSFARPGHGTSAPSASVVVVASDALFEDRVAVQWRASSVAPTDFFRVKRAGVLLTIAASTDTLHNDTSAIPGQDYNYDVQQYDGLTGSLLVSGSDHGSRIVNPPSMVAASDGTREDRVTVTWIDDSSVEAGYHVTRDGVLVATLDPDKQAWDDTTAVAGVVAAYCVSAFDPAGNPSEERCNEGSRGWVLPPRDVNATDGQYTARCVITWTGQTTRAAGYRIRRGGFQHAEELLGDVPASVTGFSDSTSVFRDYYTYCVTTLDSLGNESAAACDDGNRGALRPPFNVQATTDTYDDKVLITWADSSDAEDGFIIRRDAAVLDTLPAGTTTFSDTTAAGGTTHTYGLRAWSRLGGESDEVSRAGRRAKVIRPVNVQATDGTFEDHVDVTWESTSTTAVMFKVYRNPSSTLVATASRGARSVSIANLTSGQTRNFTVRALTALEDSSAASTSNSGYRQLKAPTGLAATDSLHETEVRLSWTDNSQVEKGYRVYRDGVLIATLPANRTSYIDYGCPPGTAHGYRVAAFDSLTLNPPGTSESDSTADSGRRDLIAPTDLAASQGLYENQVRLTWSENSGAEGGYRIRRRPASGGTAVVVGTASRNATSFIDTAPPSFGAHYEYTVAAYDSLGESLPDTAEGFTAILPPGALQASDGYSDRIVVTWVDNSAIESGFDVYRDGILLTTTSANATSYSDATASPNVTYTYQVAAVKDSAIAYSQSDTGVSTTVATPGFASIAPDLQLEIAVGGVDPIRGALTGSAVAVSGDHLAVGGTELAEPGLGWGEIWLFDRSGDRWVAAQKIDNPHAVGSGDAFGAALDMDGDFLVVGAPNGASGATSGSGTAFVYRRDPATGLWQVEQEIADPNPATGRRYGASVGISGPWIIIGVPGQGQGRIQIWKRDDATGTWSRAATLASPGGVPGGDFGTHLDMSGDAVAVGQVLQGSRGDVWVYRRSGDTWSVDAADPPFRVTSGPVLTSVALDGNTLAIGRGTDGPGSNGTVTLWDHHVTDDTWVRTQELDSPCAACSFAERFPGGVGTPVAISGSVLLVSAAQDAGAGISGSVFVYRRSGDAWVPSGKLTAPGVPGAASFVESIVNFVDLRAGSAAWGDFDGDGDQDLVVTGDENSTLEGAGAPDTRVIRNNGDGSFTGVADGLPEVWGAGAVWGDYDQDGDLDIAIAGATGPGLTTGIARIYRNTGGTFTQVTTLTGISEGTIAWGDYDNDGDLDLLATGTTGSSTGIAKVYRNGGSPGYAFTDMGALGLPGVYAQPAAAWGDYDRDGDLDVLTTGLLSGSGGSTRIGAIYTNTAGTFTDIGAGLVALSEASVAWGDYDADGDLDIAMCGQSAGSGSATYNSRIYRNDGGVFTDVAAGLRGVVFGAVRWSDYDGDGDLDLLVSGWDSGAASFAAVYRNDAGSFIDAAAGIAGVRFAIASWGDADGDGDLDVYLSGQNGIGGAGVNVSTLYLNSAERNFGGAVALGGGTAVIGAPLADTDSTRADAGAAYVREVTPRAVSSFAASDGTFTDAVHLSWVDASSGEDGFKVYRDGVLLATLPAGSQSYGDTGAEPGRLYQYGVTAYGASGESEPAADRGRRPPNGSIAGRITTVDGASVPGIRVTLDPPQNSALLLDGSGGVALVENAAIPDSALTIEFWVRTQSGNGTILSYAIDDDDDAIRIWNPGSLRLHLSGGAVLNTGVGVDDGAWHHVAVTWWTGGHQIRLYKDGVLGYSSGSAYATGFRPPPDGVLALGADQSLPGGGFGNHLEGQIDEVRIWAYRLLDSEVSAAMGRAFPATTTGLSAVWPLNDGAGDAAGDIVGGRYALLQGGVYWSGQGAPVEDSGAVTDVEGNYTLGGIRYGTSTVFRITPVDTIRSFSPAFKTITLSEGNPVQNEVAFNDVSSLSATGAVQFAGTGCPVAGANILVDGNVAGQTRSDGTFSVAVQIGQHVIRPELAGHGFDPPEVLRTFDHDVAGIAFADTTTRTLSGRMGGGTATPALPIGKLVVEVTALNQQCMALTDTLDTASASYSMRLPAQPYSIVVRDVFGVPGGLSAGAVRQFFENLGDRQVDLAAADTTLDFIYRAPATVTISGMPAPPGGCGLTAGVIDQAEQVELTISVVEDYGSSGFSPVDSGVVTVYDEIKDEEGNPVEVAVDDGVARYTTAGNYPYIFPGRLDTGGADRSYQKYITATFRTPGQATASDTEWAIVTGHRAREATIITGTTENIVATVLRQPPGDGSSATLAAGTSFCTSFGRSTLAGGGAGQETKIETGIEFQKGFGITFKTKLGVFFKMEMEAGENFENSDEYSACFTTSDEWSTSGEDIFIGNAFNLRFAQTDIIAVEDCQVVKSQGVAWDMDPENAVATSFAFTESHIRGSLIPTLQALKAADTLGVRDIFYQQSIDNWEAILAENEAAREDPLQFVVNQTFSAGASYSRTAEFSTTTATSRSTTAYFNGKAGFGFEFEEGGSGNEGVYSGTWTSEWTNTTGTESGTSRTESFTLSDDDTGDYFSTDIYQGGPYGSKITDGTAIFKLMGGRSSCPWEPNTQPRDGVILSTDRVERSQVPPTGTANFILTMVNNSQSDEVRDYILRPIQTSNPGGAVLRLNGDPFHDGIRFTLAPGVPTEATLTVARGPSRYRYDGLQVEMIPPCEDGGSAEIPASATFALADTVTLDVDFMAPCSDISLDAPEEGWVQNRAAGDSVSIRLNDFALVISARDTLTLESVGAQYRRAGTDDPWITIRTVPKDSIAVIHGEPDEVVFPWNITAVADGDYEIRAFTKCALMPDRTYSDPAAGRIDQQSPRPLGAPQPADSLLALGDEIAITFNEPIDNLSIVPGTVRLVIVNPDTPGDSLVAIGVDTDGRTVTLTPTAGEFARIDGKSLRARIQGVRDLAGNPMTSADGVAPYVEWTFEYRRSSFTWAQSQLLKDVAYRSTDSLAATLVNGSAFDVNFSITGLPSWLTAVPPAGIVRTGETLPVRFNVPATLVRDSSYVAVVNAHTAEGLDAPIQIRVDVSCQGVAWNVNPADWQFSMTLTAALTIPGGAPDTSDVVAAYVGRQLRGVARPQFVPDLGVNRVYLTVYSNRPSGETVRFKVFDQSECRLYPTSTTTTRFTADGRTGTPIAPFQITAADAPPGIVQQVDLGSGWSWMSLYLKSAEDMSVDGVLGDLNPESGDIVKSQTQFSQFVPDLGWVGSLAEFDVRSGYQIRLTTPGSIILTGSPPSADSAAIRIADGWNTIAYNVAVPESVNYALGTWSPRPGDVIRGQSGYAQYTVQGSLQKWLGDLTRLMPGQGYKLYANPPGPHPDLRYPPPPAGLAARGLEAGAAEDPAAKHGAGADGTVAAAPRPGASRASGSQSPRWQVDPSGFQYNMTLALRLDLPAEYVVGDNTLVGAFAEGTVRGLAQPMYVSPDVGWVAFLMIYSNQPSGEPITIAAWEGTRGQLFGASTPVTFDADAIMGSPLAPMALAVHEIDTDPAAPAVFSLGQNMPNPFNPVTTIRYGLASAQHVSLRLYDVTGRLAMTLVDEREEAGWHEVRLDGRRLANGVYFYRIDAGAFSDTKKMLLVK